VPGGGTNCTDMIQPQFSPQKPLVGSLSPSFLSAKEQWPQEQLKHISNRGQH
jgi:hypothetical protein